MNCLIEILYQTINDEIMRMDKIAEKNKYNIAEYVNLFKTDEKFKKCIFELPIDCFTEIKDEKEIKKGVSEMPYEYILHRFMDAHLSKSSEYLRHLCILQMKMKNDLLHKNRLH